MTTPILPTTSTGTITSGYLIDLVEYYFAAVDRNDLDAVLSCFHAEAIVTIQSAHSPHEGRDSGIRQMYVELFENYRKHMRHIHFRHVADPENNRVASQFSVELTDNEGTDISLTNANFFYLEDGLFRRVFIYMSDGVNVLN